MPRLEQGIKILAGGLAASGKFGFRGPCQQPRDSFLDANPFGEHRIDGRRDRHVDVLGMGEVDKHAARMHAFAKAASRNRFGGRQSPPHRDPEGIIPRHRRCAREDQIAEPRKAHQGSRPSTMGLAETAELGEASRDEGRSSARSESAAGGDPARDGENVFRRAADFDPSNIGRRIEPERGRRQHARERGREIAVTCGQSNGGRKALRHVPGKARARKNGWRTSRQYPGRDFGQEQSGRALDAFGANDDRYAARRYMGRENFQDWPQRLRRDHGENELRALGFGRFRDGADIRKERHARKMPRIDSGGPHLGDMRGIARPERDFGLLLAGWSGGKVGESRAPGAGAENGDLAFTVWCHRMLSRSPGLLPAGRATILTRPAAWWLERPSQ